MRRGETRRDASNSDDRGGCSSETPRRHARSVNADTLESTRAPAGYPVERRRTSERRSWKPAKFPLIDSDGTLVLADRRQQADRRLSSIIVEG